MLNFFPKDHLSSDAAHLLDAALCVRLSWLDQDFFVAWDGAEHVLQECETRFNMQSGPRRRCLLLLAQPGMGKTWIVREFLRRHKIDPGSLMASDGDRPILLVSLCGVATEEDFIVRIMTTLGSPIPRRTPKSELKERAIQLLRLSPTRILMFDECQDLGRMRSADIVHCSAYLRHMTNEGGRPLVLMGSSDTHLLVSNDEHLRSRFDVITLHPWTELERTRAFVCALLSQIPLPDPSPITDDETLGFFLERVAGNTERIALSLKGAGRSALRDGAVCIDRARLLNNIVDGIT